MEIALGLAGSVPERTIVDTAVLAEELGYAALWLSHPPGQDALRPLGRAAAATSTLRTGVGVIPLSHHDPDDILARLAAYRLPPARLLLGIGSGSGPAPLARVAAGIAALRPHTPAPLVVSALGPRMCRLAGEQADAVLFNWLTPEHARRSAAWVREGAQDAQAAGLISRAPRLIAYVRVALGEPAVAQLLREAAAYEAIPHYADHFARMGVSGAATAVAALEPGAVGEGLARWRGVVDQVVVRAIVSDDQPGGIERLARAAAPGA